MYPTESAFSGRCGDVGLVTPEANAFERDETEPALDVGQGSDPSVVEHGQPGRKRERITEHLFAESHATAYVTVSDPVFPKSGPRPVHSEERFVFGMQTGIGDDAIVDDAIGGPERLDASAYFAGQPNVVLVGEEDIIALGMVQCVLEIAVGAVLAYIVDYLDSRVVERTDDGEGGVGRSVVGDDQLVVAAQLRENGIDLFPDIFLTVVGGHANGNHAEKSE